MADRKDQAAASSILGMIGGIIGGSMGGPAGAMAGSAAGGMLGNEAVKVDDYGGLPRDYEDVAAMLDQVALNNMNAQAVDESGPYGSVTWTHTGNDPYSGWSKSTNLNDAERSTYDRYKGLENYLLGSGSYLAPYVSNALSQGGQLDQSKLTSDPLAGQDYTSALIKLAQPQLDRNRESLYSSLANRGLGINTQAYQNAVNDLGRQENDLYTQAAVQGAQTALQSRQQGIEEQYASQDRPLQQLAGILGTTKWNVPNQTANSNALQTGVGANSYLSAMDYAYGLMNAEDSKNSANKQSSAGGLGSGMGGFMGKASTK